MKFAVYCERADERVDEYEQFVVITTAESEQESVQKVASMIVCQDRYSLGSGTRYYHSLYFKVASDGPTTTCVVYDEDHHPVYGLRSARFVELD